MYKRLRSKPFTDLRGKLKQKRQFIKKMTQMTGLNLLFQKKCLYKKRNLFIKNSIVSESRQNYVYSSEPLFAAFIYPTLLISLSFLLSHTFPSIPFAIFFIEQLDSLKNWSRNFCKNSVNALGIFMVNSSGEIRSILSFFISFSSHALFEMVQRGNGC